MTTTTGHERGSRTQRRWLTLAAAVGAGATGGVFFDFSAVIMPGLRELPPAQGIAAMQAFNRTAVTPPLMLLMFVTSALCVVLAVRAVRTWSTPPAPLMLAAAIAFLLATVVITGVANVPISASIDAIDPSLPGAAARWADLAARWEWWNHARTLAAVAAAGGLVVALSRPGKTSRGATA